MGRPRKHDPDLDDLSSQYGIRTMPILPNRRTDQMRETRCRRAAQRQAIRLVKQASTGAFMLITTDGIVLDLSLEELEQRLLGRTLD